MNGKKFLGGLAGIVLGTALALSPIHAQEDSNVSQRKSDYSLDFRQDSKGDVAIVYKFRGNGDGIHESVEYSRVSMNPDKSRGFMVMDNSGFMSEGYNADIMKITEPTGTVYVIKDIGYDSFDENAMPDGKIDEVDIYNKDNEGKWIKSVIYKRNPLLYETMREWQKIFDNYKIRAGLEEIRA
jgi:hypothetical protein